LHQNSDIKIVLKEWEITELLRDELRDFFSGIKIHKVLVLSWRSFNWTFKKIDGGFNLGGSSLDLGSSDKSAHPLGVFVPCFFSYCISIYSWFIVWSEGLGAIVWMHCF